MMDKLIDFSSVLETVKLYIVDNINHDIVNIETLIDNEKCYRVILETDKLLGELRVEHDEYAPFRFVIFEVYSVLYDNNDPIFLWYDNEKNNLADILNNIKRGLEFFL